MGQSREDATDTACPDTENQDMDNLCLEKRSQLNKEKRKGLLKNKLLIHQVRKVRPYPVPLTGVNQPGRDWMQERESYLALALENIDYDIFMQNERMDRNHLDELVSSWWVPSVPAGRRSALPKMTIRRRWSIPLNSSHIEYVPDLMRDNTTYVRIIKK